MFDDVMGVVSPNCNLFYCWSIVSLSIVYCRRVFWCHYFYYHYYRSNMDVDCCLIAIMYRPLQYTYSQHSIN